MTYRHWQRAMQRYQTRIRNLRILVCVLLLLAIYGLMGRWDREAQASLYTTKWIPAQQVLIANGVHKGVL